MQDPLFFFSPVQPVTGLTRHLAKFLTSDTQPGLVSPGGGDQAHWYIMMMMSLFVLAETKISTKLYTPSVLPTIRGCLEGLTLMV